MSLPFGPPGRDDLLPSRITPSFGEPGDSGASDLAGAAGLAASSFVEVVVVVVVAVVVVAVVVHRSHGWSTTLLVQKAVL